MRMTFVGVIAANAQNDNVLSGKLHEFLGEHSRIVIAATGAAAGVRLSALVGGEAFVQDQEISSGNRFPQLPQDFVAEGAGFPGDRLVIPVRNTTGAGINVQLTVDVIPIV
jgi:hypothetical protein